MSDWEFKTTPGSDHERCTIYSTVSGKAIARHVLPEDARYIVSLTTELTAAKAEIARLNGKLDEVVNQGFCPLHDCPEQDCEVCVQEWRNS